MQDFYTFVLPLDLNILTYLDDHDILYRLDDSGNIVVESSDMVTLSRVAAFVNYVLYS